MTGRPLGGMHDMHAANDTDAHKVADARRKLWIERLAKTFPSATLRAAADRAFERELEASVFKPMECDEAIK